MMSGATVSAGLLEWRVSRLSSGLVRYCARVRSPKLDGALHRQYYRYYAGYTQGFVEDMLHRDAE